MNVTVLQIIDNWIICPTAYSACHQRSQWDVPFMAVVTSRFPSGFSNRESISKLIMLTVCSNPDSNSQHVNSIYTLCDSFKWTTSYSMINLVRLLLHIFCPCISLRKHSSALCSVALHRPLWTDVMIRSGPIQWIRVAGRWLYLDLRLI